jgi:RAB6A-GEF complex partner protein 1
MADHGDNLTLEWSPDGSRIVIKVSISFISGHHLDILLSQTSQSYLVLVTVDHKPYLSTYQTPKTTRSQRSFLSGAGEALPLQSVSLHFEGVIYVDGHLLR